MPQERERQSWFISDVTCFKTAQTDKLRCSFVNPTDRQWLVKCRSAVKEECDFPPVGSKVTYLHVAVYYAHKRCVGDILNLGADINARTAEGKTSLMIALEREKEEQSEPFSTKIKEIIQLLVQRGAVEPGPSPVDAPEEKSGIDTALFATADPHTLSIFTCAVCEQVPRNPVVFPCNDEHVICATCADSVTACPHDQEDRHDKPLIQLKGGLLRSYIGLRLKCENGCDEWQGTIVDMKQHANVCTRAVVQCDMQGCGLYFTRSDLAAHKGVCEHRTVSCSHCSEPIHHVMLKDHIDECPMVKIECTAGETGEAGADGADGPGPCEPFERRHAAQHQAECPFAVVSCPWAEYGCDHKCARHLLQEHQADPQANQKHLEAVRQKTDMLLLGMKKLCDRVTALENNAIASVLDSVSPRKAVLESTSPRVTPLGVFAHGNLSCSNISIPCEQ